MNSNSLFSQESNKRGPWREIHRAPTYGGDLVYEANSKGEVRLWLDQVSNPPFATTPPEGEKVASKE